MISINIGLPDIGFRTGKSKQAVSQDPG